MEGEWTGREGKGRWGEVRWISGDMENLAVSMGDYAAGGNEMK